MSHFPLVLLLGALCLSVIDSAPRNPIEDVPASMVRVMSQYPDEDKTMTCSGFVVDAARGWVLTAKHCIVEGATAMMVDRDESEVVRSSKWLALVKMPPMQRPTLKIARNAPKVGETTFGFGWAFGQVFLRFDRLVAGQDGTDLVVNGAFIEGMSGGPVVNAAGEVVGVVQGGVPGASWLSGVAEIRAFLEGR